MEIGPIFRTLIRNRVRFVLISLEVALTLAIVVNCLDIILETSRRMSRTTGMDEDHLIAVRSQPFADQFKERGYLENSRLADLELLRSLPGVQAAESISLVPLSGAGSASGFKPLGSELETMGAGYFSGGPDLAKTLGVQVIAGRDLTPEDVTDSPSKNVLVTKVYAERLFPEGNALGSRIQDRSPENPHTIVGIIGHMHGSWPNWPWLEHVMLFPGKPGSYNSGCRYLVRTQPGALSEVAAALEQELLKLNGGRNVEVELMSEVKARTYRDSSAMVQMLSVVILLLIFVTSLGVVGVTSFSVTERTHQIGTRRALGATRPQILRYFLVENTLISWTGLVLGVVLSFALNYVLVENLSAGRLEWQLVAAGAAVLWMIGLGSALTPALRGMRVPPAVASRTA